MEWGTNLESEDVERYSIRHFEPKYLPVKCRWDDSSRLVAWGAPGQLEVNESGTETYIMAKMMVNGPAGIVVNPILDPISKAKTSNSVERAVTATRKLWQLNHQPSLIQSDLAHAPHT